MGVTFGPASLCGLFPYARTPVSPPLVPHPHRDPRSAMGTAVGAAERRGRPGCSQVGAVGLPAASPKPL